MRSRNDGSVAGEDEEESRRTRRMKPKLNKKNADLSSDSSFLVDSESRGSSNSSSELTESDKTPEPSQLGINLGALESLPRDIPVHIIGPEDLNYKEMVERKNAVSLFDAYLQVFELMNRMEPKLFRTAVRSIKKHRSFKFDMATLKRMK